MIVQEVPHDTVRFLLKVVTATATAAALFVSMSDSSREEALTEANRAQVMTVQICVGSTFVLIVSFIALWDCVLSLLVCLLAAAWILATVTGVSHEQPVVPHTPVGKSCVKVATRAHDDHAMLDYTLGTPLPAPQLKPCGMPPLAFTMGVRSFSTV